MLKWLGIVWGWLSVAAAFWVAEIPCSPEAACVATASWLPEAACPLAVSDTGAGARVERPRVVALAAGSAASWPTSGEAPSLQAASIDRRRGRASCLKGGRMGVMVGGRRYPGGVPERHAISTDHRRMEPSCEGMADVYESKEWLLAPGV